MAETPPAPTAGRSIARDEPKADGVEPDELPPA
jgi:hypothetical protein